MSGEDSAGAQAAPSAAARRRSAAHPKCDHGVIQYCVAPEYRTNQVNTLELVMMGQSGWTLQAVHAVALHADGPAPTAACGQPYAELQDTDWESPITQMGMPCPRCRAAIDSVR